METDLWHPVHSGRHQTVLQVLSHILVMTAAVCVLYMRARACMCVSYMWSAICGLLSCSSESTDGAECAEHPRSTGHE